MLTIGVDAHKRTWVAAAVDSTGRVCGTWGVAVGPDAGPQLVAWATTMAAAAGTTVEQWGIEGAMHYGRPLAQHLVRTGAVVLEVPGNATARERRRSRGRAAENVQVHPNSRSS